MLVRDSVNKQADTRADIWAHSQGNISITPPYLFWNEKVPTASLEKLISGLPEEFKSSMAVRT